jgi:predicted MFS family arabinose efflux permease
MSDQTQTTQAAAGSGGDGRGRVIYPATVLVAMGIGSLSLGIVFFAAEVLRASPAQIGFLAATWSFHYILGCFLVRPLGGRLRPRDSIAGAATVMGLAVLPILFLHHLAPIFLCYAVYGIATAFFWPPMMGWLSTGCEGEHLNRTMGRFNLCWSGGGIVGPVLAGVLARYNPRFPVAAAGLLYLAAGLYAAWAGRGLAAVASRPPAARPDPAAAAPPAGDDASTALRYPAWAGLFAAYLVMGLTFNVFPLAAQGQMGMSKPMVGLLLFFRALATSLALGVLGRTTAWHFRVGQMVAGLVLFALVMAALPLGTTPLAAGLLLAAVGALAAHCYVNSLFHGVAGSQHRAVRMAIHEALLSAGLVVGGACGGVVFQVAGYGAVCRTAAAVLALTAAAAAIFALRNAPKPAEPGRLQPE